VGEERRAACKNRVHEFHAIRKGKIKTKPFYG
jgi:hypothetical protein